MGSKDILIRKVQVTDIDKLIEFFKKSYGEHTVFQNNQFLLYYFGFGNKAQECFNNSLIGITNEGEIVSHYGGLNYNLKVGNETHSLIWGVSAYTLPEARGKGINSKIVDYLIHNNTINGVIGFTKKTAEFYKKKGYNVFDFDRFSRFIYVINAVKTKEIINYLTTEGSYINKFDEIQDFNCAPVSDVAEIVELTKHNINSFDFDFNVDVKVTTNRDKIFLKWRLFENPYIKYKVYGYIINKKIVSYIALREENLEPFNYKICRIIDLFGNKETIGDLLNCTINYSTLNNHIYIDFSMYGAIYNEELRNHKFIELENDEICILPQVTAPIENRPNYEFIGIQSLTEASTINQLEKKEVYFTRIDSDRDRLSRINQITNKSIQ